jgi:hypothetical protein
VETRFTIDTAAFLSLDLGVWDGALLAHAEDALPQVMKGVFETLDAATKQVGNVIDHQGKKLSYDVLLDALETVRMDFNEDGTPKRMMWVMHPRMVEAFSKLGPLTPEQEQRHTDIMQKQWEQYLARRRVRKLDK